MIEQERIDAIKTTTDLQSYIETATGRRFKKNGKGYICQCPFPDHEDKTPSFCVTPDTNLFQCFGCGRGGDIFRFIELYDQVDFKEAVKRLDEKDVTAVKKISTDAPPKKGEGLTAKLKKLLNRVIGFYHTAFCEDSRAKAYLEKRGITENSLFTDFKIGFANGTLLNTLPDEGDIVAQLKEIGILNEKGTEHFYGCVTFPLYDFFGNPTGIYGRRIDAMDNKGSAPHLYLAGAREGLFNWQTAKSHKEIILTESIIDSLTLINAGIKNTIPCYGTNGFTPAHLRLLEQCAVNKVYICFDGDDSGVKGAEKLSERLSAQKIGNDILSLPEGQDINGFFLLTAEAKTAFMNRMNPSDVKEKIAVKEKTDDITQTDYGFILKREDREYEIRGMSRRDTKLKATIKGIRTENKKKRLHVDTVDFYSARSRAYLVKGLCDLFGADEKIIIGDIEKLLEIAENYNPSNEQDPVRQEIPPADKETAMAFLRNPNLFDEILSDFETIGYTGEETNKLLCYVAAISRKMESPLSVMIQSRSAAGKSYLQDTVLSLIPNEDFIKYTRLTDQALFYTEKESLKHKILAIEELDGMNGAIYSIRSIQSSKEITIAYTGKDATTGEQRTMENRVEGPLMVFITTTQVEIDGETASRFVFISIDESEAMTKKVLAKQRQSQTMEGMMNRLKSEEIMKKHKAANRLLRPLQVFNPYAELLTFTSKSLRARRDHTKYLNLISAIAYLFQYQRNVRQMTFNGKTIDYINVTLSDIEKANTISNYVLGRSLDELPPPSRALLKLIQEMVYDRSQRENDHPEAFHFTRRDIREFSGWSDFQVKTHIRQLEELEYIYAVMGKKGKEYVYELLVTENTDEDRPFLVGLTNIKQLKEKAKKEGIVDDKVNLEA